jgi:C-methyltransferase
MKDELKNIFTSYWEYLALKTACKKNIFDLILSGKNTIKDISISGNFNEAVLIDLITALEQAKTLKIIDAKIFLTKKGELLTENNINSLKYACIHWGEEHMTAWQNLEYTLTTGQQSFKYIYNKSFFDYLSDDKNRIENYHKAMNEYARDDYQNICKQHNFSIHKSITDIGGSLGALINIIYKNNPNLKCFLFDKPEVIRLIKSEKIETIKGDFFENIPNLSDAIIMSRVIHDWNNEKAQIILQNVYKALPKNGTLYLVENLTDKIEDKAALLSLNMHLITESYERSLLEYKLLLAKCNFIFTEFKKINKFQSLIIAKKK